MLHKNVTARLYLRARSPAVPARRYSLPQSVSSSSCPLNLPRSRLTPCRLLSFLRRCWRRCHGTDSTNARLCWMSLHWKLRAIRCQTRCSRVHRRCFRATHRRLRRHATRRLRHVARKQERAPKPIRPRTIFPVSYTHLDVYKRQTVTVRRTACGGPSGVCTSGAGCAGA